MAVCHLVGAGDFAPLQFDPQEEDLVIACDGGLNRLEELGRKPQVIVGDFDSYKGTVPAGEGVLRLPVEKDETDMLFAAKWGLERGYKQFFLHGSLGGRRFSHTLANIGVLAFLLEKGAKGQLVGGDCRVTLWGRGKRSFSSLQKGLLSLFAYGGACDIVLSGLKYEFEGTLTPSFPLGVSNEFIGKNAWVEVKNGLLLAVFEKSEGFTEIY